MLATSGNGSPMVALERERPTINGYSGLFPPGWDLFDTKDAAYERHVAAWIDSRKLEGVCRVASQTRKPNPQAKPERLAQHEPAVGGAGCRHNSWAISGGCRST